jgi:hypothetical protein
MTNLQSPAPQAPPQVAPARTNGMALAALILGIVSLFFNVLLIPSILGIVFGALGLRRARALGRQGMAIVGIVLSVIGIVVGVLIWTALSAAFTSAANSIATDPPAAVATSAAPQAANTPAAAAPSTAAVPTKKAAPAAPTVPVEYLSALTKAQEYSDNMHMSKQGVYDQLVSSYGEKFSKPAAHYAIDHVKADWDANALAKAKDYQSQQAMSPAAIHDQLVSSYGEKFTTAQADYAIAHLNG